MGKKSKPSVASIKKSLMEQLEKRGGNSPFFVSLVEDYCNWEGVERDLWCALQKVAIDNPERDKLERRIHNASNKKLQILKQLDIKTSNIVGGDDDDL